MPLAVSATSPLDAVSRAKVLLVIAPLKCSGVLILVVDKAVAATS